MLLLLILIPLGTLATSAAAKVRGRAAFTGFAAATATLGRLPRRLATPAAAAVLAAETSLAAALGGAVATPATLALPALAATTVLFGAFTAVLALARNTAHRTGASCHCFGPSNEPVAARHVARAATLTGLAAAGTAAAAITPHVLDPAGQPPAVLFLNACTALAAVAAAAGLDTLAWLLRRPGTPPSPWRNP